MSGYQRVLIAVDLQGNPEQVLAKVSGVTDINTASLHLVHAPLDPTYAYSAYIASSAYIGEGWNFDRKQAIVDAKEAAAGYLENAGLSNVEIHIDIGKALDIILDTAKEINADLIVIGSHGRHGIGLLLGSTANAVLHHAKCDVLAVRITE